MPWCAEHIPWSNDLQVDFKKAKEISPDIPLLAGETRKVFTLTAAIQGHLEKKGARMVLLNRGYIKRGLTNLYGPPSTHYCPPWKDWVTIICHPTLYLFHVNGSSFEMGLFFLWVQSYASFKHQCSHGKYYMAGNRQVLHPMVKKQ